MNLEEMAFFLSTFGYYMSPETGVQDLSRKPPLDLIPNVEVAVCRPKVLDHEELALAEATSKNLVKLKQGQKKEKERDFFLR